MTQSEIDFASWMAGMPQTTKDHVFTPVGKQSYRMTELLNERARLIPDIELDRDAGESEEMLERSLSEAGLSYTERRKALDDQIEEQLAIDHPDAPRVKLRGLSDVDIQEAQEEVAALNEESPLTVNQAIIATNVRFVARAFVEPEAEPENIENLRRSLNQGEWARLVDAVNTLTHQEAMSVDLPKY